MKLTPSEYDVLCFMVANHQKTPFVFTNGNKSKFYTINRLVKKDLIIREDQTEGGPAQYYAFEDSFYKDFSIQKSLPENRKKRIVVFNRKENR